MLSRSKSCVSIPSLIIEGMNRGPGARIRLLKPAAFQTTWCWRQDWISGGESMYGLLALFQILNVVQTNRIASEFVIPTQGTKRTLAKEPTVDLHSSERIHLDRVAQVTGLAVEQIARAFLSCAFPRSGWQGAPYLRWCPECLKSGHHALGFQIPIVHRCPGHGSQLIQRCPRCRVELPYKLHGASTAQPLFCCPTCKLDLVQELRTSTARPPLGKVVIAALHADASLLELCDSLPTRTGGVLTGAESMGYRELVLSMPSSVSRTMEFADFARNVMLSLAGRPSKLNLKPSLSYAEPQATFVTKSKPSLSCGWPKHIIPESDRQLIEAAAIYRRVARYLRRGVVREHRSCVQCACRRIWWPVLGSRTVALCPIAVAFIRWRMHWEGTGVPSLLLAEARSPPLGLVTWLAALAPVGSASWSRAMGEWLVKHVLARDLITSFDALLWRATESVKPGFMVWNRLAISEIPRTGWVCAGRGTASNPGRLYVMVSPADQAGRGGASHLIQGRRAHLRWHTDCLRRVDH